MYNCICCGTLITIMQCYTAMLKHCNGSKKDIRYIDYKGNRLCLQSSISLWEDFKLTGLFLVQFLKFSVLVLLFYSSAKQVKREWGKSFIRLLGGGGFSLRAFIILSSLCASTYLATSKSKHTLLSFLFTAKIHILGCQSVCSAFSKLS